MRDKIRYNQHVSKNKNPNNFSVEAKQIICMKIYSFHDRKNNKYTIKCGRVSLTMCVYVYSLCVCVCHEHIYFEEKII